MQELVGRTLGKYEIREQIGQGGMARVFKAFQPGLERLVAIKVLAPTLAEDPDFTRRFQREARAIASFNHPHIVQVYDFGQEDGYYFLVMRYVEGSRTLDTMMEAGAPVDRLLDYVVQIGEALDYAHRQGVLHRDVKPGNILIDDGIALLSDFGLVRIGELPSDLTTQGLTMGTPAYMSPEQALGDEIDQRTDIYSLGVIVFQILTGHVPHEATTPHGILVKRSIEPPPTLQDKNPNIPSSLESVVRRALATNPDERYDSAADFILALKRAQQDLFYQEVGEATMPEALTGGRAETPRRPQHLPTPAKAAPRAKRRWPSLLGAAAAAVLVLALGAFLFARITGAGDNGGNAGSVANTPQPTLIAAATHNPTATADTSAATPAKTPTSAATPTAEVAGGLPSSAGMVRIPAGTYRVGLDRPEKEYAAPQVVQLGQFWIDVYEVTNAQYAAFLEANGGPAPASWANGEMPAGQEQHPAEGVRWAQAVAYCEWAGKRLPAEAEWEVVARGVVDWLYPWGNDAGAVVLPADSTYPVGSVRENRSPFGVYDMAGNVWEWVDHPYAPVDAGHRVLRGGAHGFLKDMAYRLHGDPDIPTLYSTAGVRCAADRVGEN